MRCLVTGSAGFMGSHLVDYLVEHGHTVKGVDSLLGGYKSNVNSRCLQWYADLRNKALCETVTRDIDVIYHLAAYAAEGQSVFSPIEINDLNITPMNNLLVAAVNNGVRRIIFTSSMAAYGCQTPPFDEAMPRLPVDPYGAGKTYCENMLEIFGKLHGLEYVIIRPHNCFGPRQNIADPYRNVLGIWMNRIMRSKPPVIYGDGEQTRSFSYIEDVTPAIAYAATDEFTSEVINVGSDEVVTINEACRLTLEAMGSDLEPVHEPDRPGEVKNAYCTVEKSKRLLRYETKHSLKEGLSKMAVWAKRVGAMEPSYTLPLEIVKGAPRMWREKVM